MSVRAKPHDISSHKLAMDNPWMRFFLVCFWLYCTLANIKELGWPSAITLFICDYSSHSLSTFLSFVPASICVSSLLH
jgi:hypothetical protein